MGASDRDRYADLLRVASIVLVVFGHWLELVLGQLPSELPWAPWATWAFQVMPVFFIVGGLLNAGSWRRAEARGETVALWLRRRAHRLLAPLFPLLMFWALATPLFVLVGVPAELAQEASQVAFVPTWFLGAYLVVVALAPWTWKLHRRFGWWALAGFVAGTLALDVLARLGVPFVHDANFVLVWAGIHQLGYLWADRRLPTTPAGGVALLLGSLAALLALVTLAGYPVSMIVIDPEDANNANPPTLALFALALTQLGGAIAARRLVGPALMRRPVERAIMALGTVTLTLFLWHMSAIILTGGLVFLLGLWPEVPVIEPGGWPANPIWLIVTLTALVAIAVFFKRFESDAGPVPHDAPLRTFVGLAATLAGILWLVRWGLYGPETGWGPSIVALTILTAGLAALGAIPRLAQARRSPG